MSDFGAYQPNPEQPRRNSAEADLLAAYTKEVWQNLQILMSMGQLTHPNAARMAVDFAQQPEVQTTNATYSAEQPQPTSVADLEAARMADQARQNINDSYEISA